MQISSNKKDLLKSLSLQWSESSREAPAAGKAAPSPSLSLRLLALPSSLITLLGDRRAGSPRVVIKMAANHPGFPATGRAIPLETEGPCASDFSRSHQTGRPSNHWVSGWLGLPSAPPTSGDRAGKGGLLPPEEGQTKTTSIAPHPLPLYCKCLGPCPFLAYIHPTRLLLE